MRTIGIAIGRSHSAHRDRDTSPVGQKQSMLPMPESTQLSCTVSWLLLCSNDLGRILSCVDTASFIGPPCGPNVYTRNAVQLGWQNISIILTILSAKLIQRYDEASESLL